MKRALVVLLGALLLLLMLAAGTVVFLAATDGGTRFLAGQAERFLPVRFTDVSGALLGEIRIGRIEYRLDGQLLVIDDLTTSVETMPLLFDNRLIVHFATADAVTLTATGESAGDDSPPPRLQLPYMPLEIELREAVVERLSVRDVFPMRVAASATWDDQGLQVHYANVISEVIAGTVEAVLGNGANPSLAARASWSLPDRSWGGEGTLEGRVNDFALQHVLRGYVSVDARGRGDLSTVTEPLVDVEVAVQDLEFGDTAIRDVAGNLRGTPANLSANLGGRVLVPDLEPFGLHVVAYGPVNGPLTLRNVTAGAMGGSQEAQGSVRWREGVQVHLGGRVSEVDLRVLRPELAGRASAGFEFRFRDGLLGLALGDLQGTLNGRPIGGGAEIAQLEDGWSFDPVRITVGRNRLTGSASLRGALLNVEADVDAPGLEALALGVEGDARGRVRLAGELDALDGDVELQSSRLAGFDTALADARLRLAFSDGVVDGSLSAARASRQQLDVEQPSLTLAGSLDDLDWQAAWQDGEARGRFQRPDDGFVIEIAEARTELIEQQWSLQEPTRIEVAGERVMVGPTCVAGGGASACATGFEYQAGRIATRGELQRAPVALLRPWLPITLGDEGYLEGRWALSGSLDDLQGDLFIAARALSYHTGEVAEVIDLPDLEATGDVAGDVLRLRLAAADEAFSVVGEGQLSPLAASGDLSGRITAAATDLAPLKVFDQRLQDVAGRVDAAVDVSGTPAEPRMEGRIVLADGRVALSDPGVALEDVTLRVNLDQRGTFELRGSARQPGRDDETLRVTGSGAGLFTDGLTVRAGLEGERLEARHPDWEVTVSPDLNLTYDAGRGWIRGQVVVPRAEVRLTALPASVPSPSEDVVVVGRDQAPEADDARFRVDVEVVIGEDVTLKAMAITAELEGSLRARVDARGQTTLRGTLDITGGELTAQGQTLAIESGSVVYNGPVTRPYIDLRAVRVIDDTDPEVRVGLHIRGDADNLTSSVFSEPAMSETRALSFLVLGRDIEQETEADDSSRLLAAAINLGLSRSRGLTSGLMRRAGLDELSATAEADESFAIVAGKRISEDIYVRYTYNTLSAVGAFLVRYELSDRWQLEAYSGEQSAMDLLYTIQR